MADASKPKPVTLRPTQVALLREVEADNVTWRYRGFGPRTFHLWSDEYAYTVKTRQMQRLYDLGLVECWAGIGVHGERGGVNLTPEGRDALVFGEVP